MVIMGSYPEAADRNRPSAGTGKITCPARLYNGYTRRGYGELFGRRPGSKYSMRAKCTFLLMALVLVSCAPGTDAGPGGGDLEYPTGPDELVLRISIEGGFVPVEHNLTRLPDLSLYGDGRLITQGPQIMIYPGPALPNLLVRNVTAEGVGEIVREAAGAGLTGPDRRFDSAARRIADLPDTVFTLVTAGGTHTTSVYGLGSGEELRGIPREQADAIRELHRLRERLTGLESWLPEGSVGPEESFEPRSMRIFSSTPPPPSEEGLEQQPIAWPLAQPLAEFGEPVQPEGFRCGTVEGEDLAAVLQVASQANQLTPWESAGAQYALSWRPLLPDESGCPNP